MRLLLTLLLSTAMLVLILAPADAARRRKHTNHGSAERTITAEQRERRHASGSSSDFRDHLRATSCDPSGRYSDYPDWARAAFSCGSRF